MSTWILEAEIAVVLFVGMLPLVLLPLVYMHYRRHGRFAGWPAVVTIGTFLYACGLLAFTFFPLPDANDQFCSLREEISFWQLTPFASVGDVFDQFAAVGLVPTLTSGVFLQVAFNVVLLVPLGVFLAYRYRRGFGFTVMAGLAVSLAIELTQGTGIWGLYGCPYRLADVDDLITNTSGAAIGWVVGSLLVRVLPDPDPPPVPDVETPRIARRVLAGVLDGVVFVVVGIFVQILIILGLEVFVGDGYADRPWFDPLMASVGTVLVGAVLFLVVPAVRRDGATPGQIATWLAEPLMASDRVARRSVVLRFGVRWLPILLASFTGSAIVLVAVALIEVVTVSIRSDRRSLSALAAGTITATRRSLELGTRNHQVQNDGYHFPDQ